MNKIYKVIWSKTRNCYVAVSEIAKRNGKDRTSVTGGAAGSRQAARVLCALLLGVYLTAGYSMPVAWGEGNPAVIQGAGGYVETAKAQLASAWGAWRQVRGDYSTAFGNYTNAYSIGATAWGYSTYAGGAEADKTKGVYATAWGNLSVASGDYATAWGDHARASGERATAWGGGGTDHWTIASGTGSTAFGYQTTANTEGSTSWGRYTFAGTDTGLGTGDYATAWGNASKATGNYATAFGDSSTANAANSLAALGATVSAANSAAIGVGATASQADTVALGSGSVANRAAGVTTAKYKGSNTGNAWVSTKNAIAVGNDATDTRQITGVAAGSADTDAVNVAQLTAAVNSAGGGDDALHVYGTGVTRTGTYASAWGHNTRAVGYGSTAWGQGTIAGDTAHPDDTYITYATAWGVGTIASNQGSTAWGNSTEASGQYATAWGGGDGQNKTVASGDRSTAFGYNTTASGTGATAWGGYYDSNYGNRPGGTASGEASTAFGIKTTANTRGSTAWGDDTTAGSATIENKPKSGNNATAWGSTTKALGNQATAWGYSTTASSDDATAFGYWATASGIYSTAWGHGTTASGIFSTAWGYGTTATNEGSTAWGREAQATGFAATAWGYKSQAKGDYSTAFGGDGSTTVGTAATANAVNSLAALGGVTETAAANSAAIGKGAKASLADTVALGSGAVANRAKYDASSNPYSAAFSANATDATTTAWRSTHNAIAVGEDSTVTRQITGVAAGSADTDAVNVAQLTAAVAGAGGGTAYTAGDGIAIDDTTKAISVKANTVDFEFDSTTKALTIKKGTVASGDTGLVTGGSVFTAIQTETRVSSDGNYIQANNSAAANLSALDTQVKANTDAIGDSNSGLTKAVADNATAIAGKADKATTLSGYGITDAYTITAADAKFAMLDASNLSVENVTAWSTKLGTGSVASGNTGLVTGGAVFTEVRPVSDGTYVKTANTTAANLSALDNALAGKADSTSVYTKSDVYTKTEADVAFAAVNASNIDAAAWSTKLGTGAVASGNTGLVTGGTVFTAIQAETRVSSDGNYIKAANSAAANLSALDTQAKANADNIATNTTDIGNLKTTVGDASSGLVKAVADNTTAIAAKADASNVYTKSEIDTTLGAMNTTLNAKADKTEIADIKTTADNAKAAADTATAAVAAIGDPEKVASLVTDVETLKTNEGGEVEEKDVKNVSGEKVYNYLNKDSLELGAASTKIALGQGSKINSGTKSVAIGFDNTVDGNQNVVIGTGHTVKGNNNIAVGDPINIDGNDNGVFSNTASITGNRTYAMGYQVTITGDDTVVLGNNISGTASKAVVLGNNSTPEDGAVSVGSADNERQIKHVADGTDDTDAVNKRQLDAAIDQAVGANMVNMSNSINKLDSRINKVGAGAAALAALHPIDTDDKFTMGLGYGNYRSAHSAAIGMFYRPTEKVMFSLGGAFGNGENMINAGISFALDKGKGFGTSKAAMARKIAAQGEEIQSLKAENAEIKEQNAKLAERLAAIEAKLGK